jgi:hypothetical protein
VSPVDDLIKWADEAKRCSDQIRLHILAGMAGKWAAIRLSDGGSDGVAYDTRADAILHQFHERQCMYIKIPYDSMPVSHAATLLQIHRDIYDKGFRLSDPDGPSPVIPMTMEGLGQAVRNLGRLK